MPFPALVAEDNPADVGLARFALRDLKIECILRVASEGEQALKQIEQIGKHSRGPSLDLVLLHSTCRRTTARRS